ncbi:MAG: carboxypeptidase regulatory-like domain-containing protein [Bacteroidales bacterium]|nr:carboxypeptidase regulatory-like domain-containing protein [Bacteroidales bacterium]
MNKTIYSIIAMSLMFGLIFSAFSCREPSPPKAIVIVHDENGQAVEGARVIVKGPTSDSSHTVVYLASGPKLVADTSWTGEDGRVSYDFRYPSIYKVEVTKGSDRVHPYVRRGMGVLMLENDKTYIETIVINEQTVFN